jgi:hypothetical protein
LELNGLTNDRKHSNGRLSIWEKWNIKYALFEKPLLCFSFNHLLVSDSWHSVI